MDTVICWLLLIQYSIQLYVAPQRCQFFISPSNLLKAFVVILPPIMWGFEADAPIFQLQAFSRLFRIWFTYKLFQKLLEKCIDIEGNEVYE